jgi:hypothetical protein
MITCYSPCHGAYSTFNRTREAIEAYAPKPVLHIIGNDFSPPPDDLRYRDLNGYSSGDGYSIEVFELSSIGCTEPPNYGAGLLHVWERVRYSGGDLLVIESDVVINEQTVSALMGVARIHGPKCGCVTPLFTEVGGNTITTFGGQQDRGYLGLRLGQEIGSWDQSEVRIDVLEVCHLACTFFPSATLQNSEISPDPMFGLYHIDHDLSRQVGAAGLAILVTDRAVAQHTRGCASTGLLWPDARDRRARELASWQMMHDKWGW